MNGQSTRRSDVVYAALLMVQVLGGFFFVWSELPAFTQVAVHPGEQLPYAPNEDLKIISTVLAMQVAYWYRLRRIPIPRPAPNAFLNHLLLFLGRLSFIFGASLFSVVTFRHLPQLDRSANLLLIVKGGIILCVSLFALFCVALELERLGHAFENKRAV